MSEPARDQEIVSMVDYLRETLRKIDDTIAGLTADREEISLRLAVIEAAMSEAVEEAVADFDERAESGRPYSGEDAANLLAEAHRRHGS